MKISLRSSILTTTYRKLDNSWLTSVILITFYYFFTLLIKLFKNFYFRIFIDFLNSSVLRFGKSKLFLWLLKIFKLFIFFFFNFFALRLTLFSYSIYTSDQLCFTLMNENSKNIFAYFILCSSYTHIFSEFFTNFRSWIFFFNFISLLSLLTLLA